MNCHFETNKHGTANPKRKYYPPKPQTIRHMVSFNMSLRKEALSYTNSTSAGPFCDSYCVCRDTIKRTNAKAAGLLQPQKKIARFISVNKLPAYQRSAEKSGNAVVALFYSVLVCPCGVSEGPPWFVEPKTVGCNLKQTDAPPFSAVTSWLQKEHQRNPHWARCAPRIYFPNGRYIDCLSLTYATN